jgi:transposase-like protein
MRRRGPQKFSEEFRREAVRLATDPKRSLQQLGNSGVSVTTLRNWMRVTAEKMITLDSGRRSPLRVPVLLSPSSKYEQVLPKESGRVADGAGLVLSLEEQAQRP